MELNAGFGGLRVRAVRIGKRAGLSRTAVPLAIHKKARAAVRSSRIDLFSRTKLVHALTLKEATGTGGCKSKPVTAVASGPAVYDFHPRRGGASLALSRAVDVILYISFPFH
jgi:hypothetical protein